MSLILCLGLIGALIHIARLSGRNLQISDDGILVRDKQGNQIGGLHWVELTRVTERRRMAQLALWDKSGARRVLVDQQFENFAVIRSRILTEYAKVFALKALPIEFRNSSPLLLESFVFGSFAAFCSWGWWSTYQQGQTGLSVILLCFAVHPSCLEIESSYAPFSKQKTSTKKAFPGSSWQMSQIHGVAPNFRLSF